MKFYLLSPSSVPMNQVLFPTFIKTFESNGHEFVGHIDDAEVVMMDLHTRIAGYDQRDIDWVLQNRMPIATFCEWDRGQMSTDEWPNPLTAQQEKIFNHIQNNNIKSVHFCRLLNKNKLYPSNLYPYEKGILYEQQVCTPDELFNRQYDVCFIANSSPNRERMKVVLESDGRLKCNIILGAEKIPFDKWIDEHKKAKFFITASAGGYTDERAQALFSVSAMIRERTDQLLLHEFTDCKNCIEVNSIPTMNDLDTIVETVNDRELLYGVYLGAYAHMKMYYPQEYIANDILNKIIKHLST